MTIHKAKASDYASVHPDNVARYINSYAKKIEKVWMMLFIMVN